MITNFKLYETLIDWSTKRGKFIGKGGYGEVYEYIGKPDFVIKITTDESEYKTAKKLIGQNVEYIVKYYEAEPTNLKCNLCNNCQKYLLVMDKINTILPQTINNILDELNIYYYDHDEDFYYQTLFDAEQIEFIIEEYTDDYPVEDVKYVIEQLKKIVEECKKYDIQSNDFHSKNIGQKNGHLVFFDVGGTENK